MQFFAGVLVGILFGGFLGQIKPNADLCERTSGDGFLSQKKELVPCAKR